MINYHIDLQFAHLITSSTHYSLVTISAICVTRFVIKVIDGGQTCERPKDDSINKFNTYFNLITSIYIWGRMAQRHRNAPTIQLAGQPACVNVLLLRNVAKRNVQKSERGCIDNATRQPNFQSFVAAAGALTLYHKTSDGGGGTS